MLTTVFIVIKVTLLFAAIYHTGMTFAGTMASHNEKLDSIMKMSGYWTGFIALQWLI